MGKRLEEARRIKPYILKGAQSLSDSDALEIKSLYPVWAADTAYTVDTKAQYGDRLYRCLQAHTSQADWTPDAAASLWTVIDEQHEGTYEDPIPYDGNMELFEGKYYVQDEVIYLCIRSTGIAVHHPLSELVGIYVEVANG